MATSVTSCPCCDRAVGLTRSGRLYVHMPYKRRADADIFDRGRRCPGSSKTLSEAQRAADDRTERRAAWFRALSSRDAEG
jgi:hypothetical protein